MKDDGHSLFDELEQGASRVAGEKPDILPGPTGLKSREALDIVELGVKETASVSPPLRDWHEVPAARFLSWTAAMQFAYCRDRDLDSAERAESEWWRDFYTDRALWYDGRVR